MFGPHVGRKWAEGKRPSITQHIREARCHARSCGFDARAFQIFIAGPQTLNMVVKDGEAEELRQYIEEENIFVVAHGTYQDVPWSESPRVAYMRKFIRKEVAAASKIGIAGIVVHLGVPDVDRVIEALPWLIPGAEGFDKIRDPSSEIRVDTRLYLEVPHVKPVNSHYETAKKLGKLFKAIRKSVDPGLRYFGLCIDTAHIWASGADISSYDKAAAWLEDLESLHRVIPPKALLFHLNDNVNALGSGVDQHATLLQGEIWGAYAQCPQKSGLAAFVDFAVRHDVPTILERSNSKAEPPAKGPAAQIAPRAPLCADYQTLLEMGAKALESLPFERGT